MSATDYTFISDGSNRDLQHTISLSVADIAQMLKETGSDEDMVALIKEYDEFQASWETTILLFESIANMIFLASKEIITELKDREAFVKENPDSLNLYSDELETLKAIIQRLYKEIVLGTSVEKPEYEELEDAILEGRS